MIVIATSIVVDLTKEMQESDPEVGESVWHVEVVHVEMIFFQKFFLHKLEWW